MSENQNTEYKKSWHDDYLKWICGFANANGGVLYIGVDDGGEVVGVADAKKLLENLPNRIQSLMGIICDDDLLKKDSKNYIRVKVSAYDVPISYHGVFHYRSGSTKQELKGQALQDFLLKKMGRTWDSAIEPNAKFSDIDTNAVKQFINNAVKAKRMPKTETDIKLVLENLNLIKGKEITRAALLLFGKNPQKYFIDSHVKIGRFKEAHDSLQYQEVIEGNIFQMVDEILKVLHLKFLISPISYEGVHRIETSPYPEAALREIILNALAHRDYFGSSTLISVYNDMLMVWNDGALPEGITIEQLRIKHTSKPRNKLIAGAFYKGGLIESWGQGTVKVISECIAAGLPEPKFENNSGGFMVTLFASKWNEESINKLDIDDRLKKAIRYAIQNGSITNADYQKVFAVSRITATRDLQLLIKKEIFRSIGTMGRGAKYTIAS